MLASTVQFSSYDRAPHPTLVAVPTTVERYDQQMRPAGQDPTTNPRRDQQPGRSPKFTTFRLFPQDPTACQANPSHPVDLRSLPTASCRRTRSHRPSRPTSSRCSTLEHHHQLVRSVRGPGHPPPPMTGERGCQMLLRKEVIQPHLPVRLPCYDLVPIASPTFDSSLHKGWATGFGCYRLS